MRNGKRRVRYQSESTDNPCGVITSSASQINRRIPLCGSAISLHRQNIKIGLRACLVFDSYIITVDVMKKYTKIARCGCRNTGGPRFELIAVTAALTLVLLIAKLPVEVPLISTE